MTTITRDEWLKAMSEAGLTTHEVDDQSALTVPEFAEMMKCPRGTADTKLRALEHHGKAIKTRKTVLNSYGRLVSMKAFKLVVS